MRRKQSEITEKEEIIRILNEARIGRMASIDGNGFPYITPVNFVFDKNCVYFHCAREGEKLENIDRNPNVGFEVDHPLAYVELSFDAGRNPCALHQFYESVIIRGTARILPDGARKAEVLNALVAKHEGHMDFEPITPDTHYALICAVVEIKPESMTGKADLAQNKPRDGRRREIAERLVKRGLPGDLEAARKMGYGLEPGPDGTWILKQVDHGRFDFYFGRGQER